MIFTKRHYESIATVFSNAMGAAKPGDPSLLAVALLAYDLTEMFAEDNPAFDRARFLEACGIKEFPQRG